MANKTNYYNSKPKDKKWVGKLIACVATGLAIVTAVSALGVGTTGFKDWSFSRWFPKTETVAPAPEASEGGTVITEGEGNCMRLMSAMVPAEEYETYGIDARSVENVFDLSVEYIPADTTYQETTYSVAFKNPSSAWATGKKATDYATVTQPSVGSKTATLQVKQAFGEPIIVTAQSNRNPAIKATRTVNYVGAYYMSVKYTAVDDIDNYIVTSYQSHKEGVNSIVGTVLPELNNAFTIVIHINNSWVSGMKTKGCNMQSTVTYTHTPTAQEGANEDLPDDVRTILYRAGGVASASASEKKAYWQKLSSVVLNNRRPEDLADTEIFTYDIISHKVYNGVTYKDVVLCENASLECGDWSGFEVSATSMTTDTTPIIAG